MSTDSFIDLDVDPHRSIAVSEVGLELAIQTEKLWNLLSGLDLDCTILMYLIQLKLSLSCV